MPLGPCIGCGATNYSRSFGGEGICPSCDSGVPPLRLKVPVAPFAAPGPYPTAMRPATAEEAAALSVFIGKVPNLWPVIQWLEGGCDSAWAAKELRAYAAQLGQVEPATVGVGADPHQTFSQKAADAPRGEE